MDVAKEALEAASPYSRHLGIFNPHKFKLSASVVGCGAIGSFVAVGLAKMGVKDQTIFDMDKVEIENLPVQLHSKSGIGREKTEMTAEMIRESCPEDVDVATKGEWHATDSLKTDIVVAAVDSLPVRKAIWESVKYDDSVKILVDARIGGTAMKLFAVNPIDQDDIKKYDASFPTGDMEGSELPCTERGVIDVSLFASAMMIRSIRRWVVGKKKETYRIVDLASDFPNVIG
jgi:sulfur carrier protein ThiS adenylyltransferase